MLTPPINARFRLGFTAADGPGFLLDVDLSFPGKGISAIFGHSGSGKTTLLRCIAGLQKVDAGALSVNGETWQDDHIFLPTYRRPLGYVFQEASLFPHLTARKNLLYAVKRSPTPADLALFHQVTALMDVAHLLEKFPHQLSGGERQRVAIARALLIKPRLLLMDEPLASLDSARKQDIMPYLENLHEQTDIPILYVSHAIDEVARLADYLVVLEQGKSIAHGPLVEVLSTLTLPIQLGEETGVIINGSVIERNTQWHLLRVVFDGGEFWVKDNGDTLGQTVRVRILARDISLALTLHDDTSIINRIAVEITEIIPDRDAAMSLVKVKAATSILIARITRRSLDQLQLSVGCNVWAQIKSVAVVR